MGWAATGANFSQFEKRGVTHTGCLLATSDGEMGKIGPVPSTSTQHTEFACPGPEVGANIRPYFILALDGGPATAFGLGFV
jgi:hypothetical protein